MSYTLVVIKYEGPAKRVICHSIYEEFTDGLQQAIAYTTVFESENKPRMKCVTGPISHMGMYTDMYIDAMVVLDQSESKLIRQALRD